MKTCAGRIASGATKTPIAKITGYSINKTHNTEEKSYLDDNCLVRKDRTTTNIQLAVEGEIDITDTAQGEVEDMEGGELHIFIAGEVSGAPHWRYQDCSTASFNITGNAGGSITFQATIDSNGGKDPATVTVP